MSGPLIRVAVALVIALALAALPRVWWLLVGLPRFRRRCDLYIEHVDGAWATTLGKTSRCPCAACVAFRKEMGWPP